MQIGRNDPCPCGSGKKYKKCCMKKNEEMQRAQRVQKPFEDQNQLPGGRDVLKSSTPEESPQPTKPAKAKEPDPHIEAINARWEEFEEQDYEGQIALFLKTLEEPKLLDDEIAFEMLNAIYQKAAEHHEYDRYDALIEQLRERLPKIYDKSAPYYLKNRISNAVITGRFDRVPIFMNELTPYAYKDIDIFNKVVDQLAYHGQLGVLLEAFKTAWPKVKKSPRIVPWGIDEFAVKTVKFFIFDYLEQHGADASGHPKLFGRIKTCSEIGPEQISRMMSLLTGQFGHQWSREDFTFDLKLRSRDDGGKAIHLPETVQQNLFDISLDFQGHLWREQNVSLTKSELGRGQLVTYLAERLAGDLEPRKSMFEAVVYPNRPGPKKRSPTFYLSGEDDSVHWLCPDRETLDAFLARLFDFLNWQFYTAAALFEVILSWLHFLELHQLISASVRQKTLRDLQGLRTDLRSVLRKADLDPALQSAIENWEKETPPETS
jgi:hypothetical protein